MSGDIVYADIKTAQISSSKHSPPPQKTDSHHYGIFQKAGCAMIILLVVIIIVLSIFVIQLNSAKHSKANNESIKKDCTGENKSGTNSSIDSSNSSTANQSCPSKDWQLHGGKCYWVSESKNSWGKSQADCAAKNSQLIVIRDLIDMYDVLESMNYDFLTCLFPASIPVSSTQQSFLWLHLKASSLYWIGLSYSAGGKLWVWMDNSSFDPDLFSIKESSPGTRSMKCARVSHAEIAAENCENNHQWICGL